MNTPYSASAWDGGKKVGGKRHLIVACLGLALALAVTAANVQDRDAAVPLFSACDGSNLRPAGVGGRQLCRPACRLGPGEAAGDPSVRG